jgi:nucleotide-binding universal stress UspA family protein
MRIVIACDGSEITESAVASVAALGAGAAAEVHLLTVIDPNDLHGRTREVGSSPLFASITTGQGEIVGSSRTLTATPEPIGLVGHEGRGRGADPAMTEDRSQALDRARAEHYDYLRVVAAHYLPGREVAQDIVFSHDPAGAIAEHASQLKADVIALGSHGRSGLSRAIMGSVAEQLVRHASVPVLVVGPTARQSAGASAPAVATTAE